MTTFNINNFRTDESLEKQGVWIALGGEAAIKVASFDNADFQKGLADAVKPYQELGIETPPEEQERIMIELLSKHVLVDWKHIYEGEEALPYTEENAVRVLTEISFVRKRVLLEAKKLSNYKAKTAEETTKNS